MALGLILSSSDFNVVSSPGAIQPASHFTAGSYGAPSLNSSLSAPLTNSGDFCRAFASSDGDAVYGAYYVNQNVDSGLYSGSISISKAYSIRAWVRAHVPEANACEHTGIGLFVMGQSNAMSSGAGDRSSLSFQGGYCLLLSGQKPENTHTSVQDNLKLWIGNLKVSGSTETAAVADPIICSGSGVSNIYAKDTWHRVRLDMIPVGTAGVTLNAYTSSAGDVESGQEVWEGVGTRFIAITETIYIPPTLPANGMGFYAFRDDGDGYISIPASSYIDQFEILVQDL